jgi:hypothetical protein
MAAEAVADRSGSDLTNGTILQAVVLDTEWEEEGDREKEGEIVGEKEEGIGEGKRGKEFVLSSVRVF